MNSGYKFKDPAFAEGVERHRSMLNNLEATLTDLAVARMGLEETINSCDDPATRGKLMKDSVQLAAMVTKVSKEITDLQFRLNELIGKDALSRIALKLSEAMADTILEETDAATQARIVDRFVPKINQVIADAAN